VVVRLAKRSVLGGVELHHVIDVRREHRATLPHFDEALDLVDGLLERERVDPSPADSHARARPARRRGRLGPGCPGIQTCRFLHAASLDKRSSRWAQATWSPRVAARRCPAPPKDGLAPATNRSTRATTSSLFSVAQRSIDVFRI